MQIVLSWILARFAHRWSSAQASIATGRARRERDAELAEREIAQLEKAVHEHADRHDLETPTGPRL